MKLKTLFFVLFILNLGVTFGQAVFTQSFKRLASIDFPDTPKTSTTSGFLTYKATQNNNSFVVLVYNIDTSKNVISSAKSLNDFYDGVIDGTINVSKNIKLKYKKNIIIDGLKGIEFEYTITVNSPKTAFVYQRVVYFNNTAFAYMFITAETQANSQAARDKFFNSFKVTLNKNDVKQFATATELAYKVGYAIGKLVSYALIAGVVVLIVVFIKKKSSKKKAIYNE